MVNIMHGPEAAIKAACVQGSYSFVITLGMTLTLEAMFRFFLKVTNWYWFSGIASVVIGCTPVFVGSWMINVAAGTPEVFETVILGYIIGSVYSSVYVYGLVKKSKH